MRNSADHVRDAVEATVASAASKATGTGSAVTFLGWFTSSDFGMWAGIVIGVAGLVISWYFKHKAELRYEQANRRYEEAHEAYMFKIKQSGWLEKPPTPKEEEAS